MADGYLTTHVLDTAKGQPAAGMRIELFRINSDSRVLVTEKTTNNDGRTDGPILPQKVFDLGQFELVFHAGDYLRASGQATAGLLFLDVIPIRFGMTEQDHYHVPLLLSPFSYSTYRGS